MLTSIYSLNSHPKACFRLILKQAVAKHLLLETELVKLFCSASR